MIFTPNNSSFHHDFRSHLRQLKARQGMVWLTFGFPILRRTTNRKILKIHYLLREQLKIFQRRHQ